jgi:hypothetical protein
MEPVITQSMLCFYFQEGQNKRKHGKANDIFVSAEEFSEMLDSVGASGLKVSGSSALSNRDNAGKH